MYLHDGLLWRVSDDPNSSIYKRVGAAPPADARP